MTQKISRSILFILILFVDIFYFSCKKRDADSNNTSSTNSVLTTIAGMVVDEYNKPIFGVTISVNGKTVITDMNGGFALPNISVPKERCVIKAEKNGSFYNSFFACIPSEGSVTYVRVKMLAKGVPITFNATSGTTLNFAGGATVVLPSNGYIDPLGNPFTGVVTVRTKYLNPDETNFNQKIPGNDLLAIDKDNNSRILLSYGMVNVELTDASGNHLQLANGASASVNLPIANSQISSAPSTLPLWSFDENLSMWKEEGIATKIGNMYVGTVKHFTWWNVDKPREVAKLKLKVVDCNGESLPNILVHGVGIYTDNEGKIQSFVPVNTKLQIQVLGSENYYIFSDSKEFIISSLANNEVYDIGVITVDCVNRIKGTVNGCNGEIIPVIIKANWGDSANQLFLSTNGNYNFLVPNNKDINISISSIYNLQDSRIKYISTRNKGEKIDIGNITICNQKAPLEKNTLYVTGMGFENKKLIIDTKSIGSCSFTIDTSSGYFQSANCCFLAIDKSTNDSFYINIWLQNIATKYGFGYWNLQRESGNYLEITNLSIQKVIWGTQGMLYSADYHLFWPKAIIKIHTYNPYLPKFDVEFNGILYNEYGVHNKSVIISGGWVSNN